MRCSLNSCNISSRSTQKRCPPISFHRFPRDEFIRKCWMTFCGLGNLKNLEGYHLCSQHFQSNDFENMYMKGARRNLIKTAVPTIRDPLSEKRSSRTERAIRKARSQLVSELIQKYESQHNSTNIPSDGSNFNENQKRIEYVIIQGNEQNIQNKGEEIRKYNLPLTVEFDTESYTIQHVESSPEHDYPNHPEDVSHEPNVTHSGLNSPPYPSLSNETDQPNIPNSEYTAGLNRSNFISLPESEKNSRLNDIISTQKETIRNLEAQLRKKDQQIDALEKKLRLTSRIESDRKM